ncbi:1739_t:CDS:1, partial [Dentiscutata heterogama]
CPPNPVYCSGYILAFFDHLAAKVWIGCVINSPSQKIISIVYCCFADFWISICISLRKVNSSGLLNPFASCMNNDLNIFSGFNMFVGISIYFGYTIPIISSYMS